MEGVRRPSQRSAIRVTPATVVSDESQTTDPTRDRSADGSREARAPVADVEPARAGGPGGDAVALP